MSSEEDKSQKTEDPTPKKLQDARKKGDVPSSKEVGTVVSVFVLMIIVFTLGKSASSDVSNAFVSMLQGIGSVQIGEHNAGLEDTEEFLKGTFRKTAVAIAPMFLLMIVAAVFGVVVQGETVVAGERIKPKLSNISLSSGFKRIFSLDALVEFTKSIIKVSVVAVIGYFIIIAAISKVWQTPHLIPETLPGLIQKYAGLNLLIVTCILMPLAIFDIIWKRMQWIKKNRMSLKEVRDEHKDSEGDPEIKKKRAERRQQLSQQRMTEVVPRATMILTNPTHFSVAIEYDPKSHGLPVVSAKGVDARALEIRRIAKENDVPIFENKPLARSLYSTTHIGDVIPNEHFEVVAQIIGYIQNMKKGIRSKLPFGSEHRTD